MTRRQEPGISWKRGNWKAIPGFPGYEASYTGRLRDIAGEDGKTVILKSTVGPCGFHTLQLGRHGRKYYQVGKLVALAWIGALPDGATVRYLDGNLQNHNAANLACGTRKEFYQDQEARARREEQAGAPTHCQDGHPYSDTWFGGWGERRCGQCLSSDRRARYPSRKYQDKPCQDCGAVMEKVHYQRELCDECGSRHLADYEEGRKVRRRKGPRTSHCIDCSAEIVGTGPGPLGKRCPEHKAQARRETWLRSNHKRRKSS